MDLFRGIMLRARDASNPLGDLVGRTGKLGRFTPWGECTGPEGDPDGGEDVAPVTAPEGEDMRGFDAQGNPRWIHLPPQPDRPDSPDAKIDGRGAGGRNAARLEPDPVLPDAAHTAAPPPVTWASREGAQKKRQPGRGRAAPKSGRVLSLLGTVLFPFSGKNPEEAETPESVAARERAGKGFLLPRRPRPLRSCMRMLLVTAVLGCLYAFLARLGWAPPLW